jgi:hypothetical protein
VTEPKKQDGTMELDVGQIDLLDLPLPPRSKPTIEAAVAIEEPRVSKGPPPLPPSGPPPAEEDPPVPSLALPQSQPQPSQPNSNANVTPAAISARSLAFGPPQKQKSPAVQLMIGMGGATVLCVVAFFVWRATHKTPVVANPPAASASAALTPTSGPTQAFTMAPIEFTSPASSGSAAPQETASAHASSSAPTATSKPAGTTHTGTGGAPKPPRTDELIKVEN